MSVEVVYDDEERSDFSAGKVCPLINRCIDFRIRAQEARVGGERCDWGWQSAN